MSIRRVTPIAEADWIIAPPAEWVVAREPDWSFTPAAEHGVAFLLIDEQHHVATLSAAHRVVRRPLTLAAVQTLGQVEIDFDPAAQRLRIHELAVWRQAADGAWEKRSVATRDTFLIRQREPQLEQQMLNGRASVVALLEDLRTGDAIDLAWTVEPHDPLPGLRFTVFHAFFWTEPVARVFFTLHLDAGQPVHWRLHTPPDPTPLAHESTPEYATWSVEQPPLFTAEPNAPAGDWPFPVLDVSGWRSWSEVAAFAAALWADALADAGDLVAVDAARLRVEGNVAASISAAIRFVQEDVRYLAIDFGHGSGMLPNGAGTVLRRRFGDCKDKSVLLAALLRALGCAAWPLLVAPGWHRAVARVQPSTAAFSHAIVTFFFEGKRHFVDPTLFGQSGDLAHLLAPPYGFGLEVRAGSGELIELPERPLAELKLTETFHLDRKQQDGWVEQSLRVTSWLADDVRATLVRSGRAAFFKSRAEALQRHFSALVPGEAGGEVQDDPATNVIELHARHALPTWGPPKERPPDFFRYGAHGLFLAVEHIEGPETRRQPWALRHPMRVHHRVVVTGRCVRKAKVEKHRFGGPGFRYSCDVGAEGSAVTFDYVWETTQPVVSPEEWPAYCRERARAFECAGANVATPTFWTIKRGPMVIAATVIVVAVIRIVAEFSGAEMRTPQLPPSLDRQQLEREARMAGEAMRRGDYVAAAPTLEALYRFYKSSTEYHLMRGETALQTGNLERADESLAEARRLDPTNEMANLLDAMLRARRGDPAGARQILEQILGRQPGDVRALVVAARVNELLGDSAAAAAAWAKLLAIQPGHPEALLHSALIAWRNGETERADAMIPDAIRTQPAPSAALEAALADYFTGSGRIAEAQAPAERAAQLAPNDSGAAFRQVLTTVRAGDNARAGELARAMTERFPTQPAAWNARATASATAGDNETAATAFREWLRLAPRDAQAHAGYGFFLFHTGHSLDARRVLEQAAREFPVDGFVWLNYSMVLEALGERSASLAARQKAEALIPAEKRAAPTR